MVVPVQSSELRYFYQALFEAYEEMVKVNDSELGRSQHLAKVAKNQYFKIKEVCGDNAIHHLGCLNELEAILNMEATEDDS